MDQYLATILEMGLQWAPDGMLPCDGRQLDVRNNAALYSLLGNQFGGDGVNNFALPDLRPVDANGQKRNWYPGETRKFIVTNGLYPSRP